MVERVDCFFDTVGLVTCVSLEGEGAAESDTILFEARPPSEKRNGTLSLDSTKFQVSKFLQIAVFKE